jgi:hypothetical protein
MSAVLHSFNVSHAVISFWEAGLAAKMLAGEKQNL